LPPQLSCVCTDARFLNPALTSRATESLRKLDLRQMAAFCRDHGIALLAYGTVLGGLLSEKFLGRPEPRQGELNTASLQKYKNMIDAWGGWALFQELLAVLEQIADKHRVSIANAGMRYILERPAVAGVIVGTRLGVRSSSTTKRACSVLQLTGRRSENRNGACEIAQPVAADWRLRRRIIVDARGEEFIRWT